MTRDELIAFGKERHGNAWLEPLAREVSYSFSHLWRISEGQSPITRRLELEIERLRQVPAKEE